LAIEKDEALCNDFNLSTDVATTVMELAQLIWKKINPNRSFEYICDEPFIYDVQKRTPDISKAKRILKWEPTIGIDELIEAMVESDMRTFLAK
jgi:nucleoside-diphosphate-sugar epimerase